jgi:hypothetical protein
MKVGIMQPYFLPYLGYFSLIQNTDYFILLDEVQFIRHGWIERNRILKEGSDWMYIKVPLKKENSKISIKQTLINNDFEWESKILAQLQPYKKRARYYFQVIEIIHNIFNKKYSSITELNCFALKQICIYLELQTEIVVFSELNLQIEKPLFPDEWALNICKALPFKVKEYWNSEGGKAFFDPSKYVKENIKLAFIRWEETPYVQRNSIFESGLSVIDVMMFNSPAEIRSMLYKISVS